MGWRYRKSIKLPGGFRINLSKSGIGYSWGVKGYRIAKTANGKTRKTYSIPGTGLIYSTESNPKAKNDYTPIRSPKISFSKFSNPKYNELAKQFKLLKVSVYVSVLLILIGVISVFFSLFVGLLFIAIGILLLLLNLCLSTINVSAKTDSKSIENIIKVWMTLSWSECIWLSRPYTKNAYGKIPSHIREYTFPPFIKCNNKAICVDINGGKIIISGEKVILSDSFFKHPAILNGKDLFFEYSEVRCWEDSDTPVDAPTLSSKYLHQNADGSRDKRYKENYKLYYKKYGEIDITSSTGFSTALIVSNLEVAKNFVNMANKLYKNHKQVLIP